MASAGWGFLGVKGTRSVNAHSVAVVDLCGRKAVRGAKKRVRTVVTSHVDVTDAGELLDCVKNTHTGSTDTVIIELTDRLIHVCDAYDVKKRPLCVKFKA